MTGIVKWFNARKGYGFIATDNGDEYFVHQTSINMDGFRSLKQEQRVTFDTKETEDGRIMAVNVTVV